MCQAFQKLRVPLPAAYTNALKRGKQTIWNIAVAKPEKSLQESPFAGKCNMRLTRVRFFAPGAKTTSGVLEGNLDQLGSEDMNNQDAEEFHFSHAIVGCLFVYNLATGSPTIDGNIGEESEKLFANVGPFSLWRITTSENLNPGLDLSAVTDSYLEFDGTFQAFPPS